MTFKEMSARIFEPVSQWIMILGIVALLQPWSLVLHRYGVTIILVGLVGFTRLLQDQAAAAARKSERRPWPRSRSRTSRSISATSTSSGS